MKKLNFTKKILLVLVLAISAIFFNSYALIVNLTSYAAYSGFAVDNYGSTSIEIKNGKFTSHSSKGDGVPEKADDWFIDKIDDKEIEGQKITASLLHGVLNVNEESYDGSKFNYKPVLAKNPGKPKEEFDNYILAMASNDVTNEQFGYFSSSVNLDNGKYYALSIYCKTVGDNARASIYTSLSNEDSDNFLGIKTSGLDGEDGWEPYYFLIATDSFNSLENFRIELRIGSSRQVQESSVRGSNGAVFFDQVELTEIANSDFYSAKESRNLKKFNFDNDYVDSFKNADFENGLEGFTTTYDNSDAESVVEVTTANTISQTLSTKFSLPYETIADNYTGTNGGNNKELLIMNVDPASTLVKTNEDNKIKISQHGFYRLSMLIKTGNLSSGGLDVTLSNTTKLISTGEEELTKSQNGFTSTSGGANNGFTRMDFYINGNVWQDCELSLSFALGSEETKISGWAIIDNIVLQQISGEEYGKGSDSNQLNLSKNVPDTNDFTNGSFNFVTSSNSAITYPYAPKDWKASSNLTGSGIIRVRTEFFNKDCFNYGLYGYQNPGPNNSLNVSSQPNATETRENVLMVRNNTSEDVYFKSNPSNNVTLSANSIDSTSIAKVSVAVKTQKNSKAFIQVVSGDNVIANIDNISASDWTTYTIYIKNGIASKTINLILGTHGNGNNNYSFFDHISYKSNDETFNLDTYLKPQSTEDTVKYRNSTYVDLLENGFYSHSNEIVTGNIYKQNSMLIHQSENVSQYNGIINTADNEQINVRKDSKDTNVLVVTNENASCQVLKTIDTYELKQNNYYEFSVWIKTSTLTGINDKNFGAYFELVAVDDDGNVIENKDNKNKFTNIIVTDTENNGWVKYSIFVLAETDQNVKVLLGLGNGENATQGTVYFDDLKIVGISENEYASQKADKTTLISKVIELKDTDNDESNDNNNSSSDEDSENGINIWALLSSIIIVIALILAIAGFLIRKLPKRKIAKIKAGEYEKSPFAVDENEIRRQLKLDREQKVVDINKQLEELEKEKAEQTNKYDEELEKIDNDKEKNKLYITHTKEINKLDKKINYLQSALTFITDPTNIRNEEIREIKEQKQKSREEFLKIKQEELEKEQAKQEEQETEVPKKRKKNRYRSLKNKNK